jgi:hypothetical protein
MTQLDDCRCQSITYHERVGIYLANLWYIEHTRTNLGLFQRVETLGLWAESVGQDVQQL